MHQKIQAVCSECSATRTGRYQMAHFNPTPEARRGSMGFKKGKKNTPDEGKLFCKDCWKGAK